MTIMHWPLQRQSSWVQLSGHQGMCIVFILYCACALNCLSPCKHPVGLFITLVDLLLTRCRKLPSERCRGGAEAVQ